MNVVEDEDEQRYLLFPFLLSVCVSVLLFFLNPLFKETGDEGMNEFGRRGEGRRGEAAKPNPTTGPQPTASAGKWLLALLLPGPYPKAQTWYVAR